MNTGLTIGLSALGAGVVITTIYLVTRKKSHPTAISGSFPLKYGDSNANVLALQNSLISQFGASILPKSGASGVLNDETVAALAKMNFTLPISSDTYNFIVSGKAKQIMAAGLAATIPLFSVTGEKLIGTKLQTV